MSTNLLNGWNRATNYHQFPPKWLPQNVCLGCFWVYADPPSHPADFSVYVGARLSTPYVNTADFLSSSAALHIRCGPFVILLWIPLACCCTVNQYLIWLIPTCLLVHCLHLAVLFITSNALCTYIYAQQLRAS